MEKRTHESKRSAPKSVSALVSNIDELLPDIIEESRLTKSNSGQGFVKIDRLSELNLADLKKILKARKLEERRSKAAGALKEFKIIESFLSYYLKKKEKEHREYLEEQEEKLISVRKRIYEKLKTLRRDLGVALSQEAADYYMEMFAKNLERIRKELAGIAAEILGLDQHIAQEFSEISAVDQLAEKIKKETSHDLTINYNGEIQACIDAINGLSDQDLEEAENNPEKYVENVVNSVENKVENKLDEKRDVIDVRSDQEKKDIEKNVEKIKQFVKRKRRNSIRIVTGSLKRETLLRKQREKEKELKDGIKKYGELEKEAKELRVEMKKLLNKRGGLTGNDLKKSEEREEELKQDMENLQEKKEKVFKEHKKKWERKKKKVRKKKKKKLKVGKIKKSNLMGDVVQLEEEGTDLMRGLERYEKKLVMLKASLDSSEKMNMKKLVLGVGVFEKRMAKLEESGVDLGSLKKIKEGLISKIKRVKGEVVKKPKKRKKKAKDLKVGEVVDMGLLFMPGDSKKEEDPKKGKRKKRKRKEPPFAKKKSKAKEMKSEKGK